MPCQSDEPLLFDVPQTERVKKFKQFEHPIWTQNKAKLIERYLYYFAWVTRHGTYIDGFSGPQRIEEPGMWAARLVLDNRPRLLRRFHLFEIESESIRMLQELKANQPPLQKSEKRTIDIYPGDFNQTVVPFLRDKPIKPTEATFCLLDQRTFECDWETVVRLATHKKGGNKIELFYFLASGWIHRAAAGIKNDKPARMSRWFGSDKWQDFLELKGPERATVFTKRFKDEFGYKYVYAFPIFGSEDGHRRTKYWMIHASDHEAAPVLMHRAYRCALETKEDENQLQLITREAENVGTVANIADKT